MSNLLVLHKRHTPDDASVWRAAIQRGWRTERVDIHEAEWTKVRGYDRVRYYGNVLHASQIAGWLPIHFTPIPDTFLQEAARLGYTKRGVTLVPFSSLPQPLDRDLFIKSAGIKWFESRVYKAGETVAAAGLPDDPTYVQDVVEFMHEVRCFVLDGEIKTCSYYRIDKEFSPQHWRLCDVDSQIVDMAASLCSSLSLPRGVVLDFGSIGPSQRGMGHQEWALIEANEAWASGLYDNDPTKVFNVVEASQEDR